MNRISKDANMKLFFVNRNYIFVDNQYLFSNNSHSWKNEGTLLGVDSYIIHVLHVESSKIGIGGIQIKST